jgi:F420-non-reducing hydrogenase small subunit
MSKPKAGFYWCASCGGCEESVVDLAEDILDVVAAIDFVFFFINGAIRSSEQREMAELLRRKSQHLIAYGSCSHMGGVPGLANLHPREAILEYVYHDSPSTVNDAGTRPLPRTVVPEGEVELPVLDEEVKSLDQVVEVDYSIPGCPPPVALLKGAVEALLAGALPPRGSVLAPDKALCDDCPRIATKPERPLLSELRRPHEIEIDHETCLLAQGLLCLGPATRSGCGHPCINGNMPCTGCLGPVSRARDHGGAIISALASLVDSNEETGIEAALVGVPDPVGTFCRYGLPGSELFGRVGITAGNGEA